MIASRVAQISAAKKTEKLTYKPLNLGPEETG